MAQLYRFIQKLMVLDVTHLLVKHLEVSTDSNVYSSQLDKETFEIRVATSKEIREHSKTGSYPMDAKMASRIDAGFDTCLAVFESDRIVCYSWFARNSIEAEFNRGDHPASGVPMQFGSDTMFVYSMYTIPSRRGFGLSGAVMQNAFKRFSQEGISCMLTTTDWTNSAAIRVSEKMGFHSDGLIWRAAPFGTPMTIFPKRAARALGVTIGDIEPTQRQTPRPQLSSH